MTDILIITFNRKDFLKQTIDALYERTRRPFRLIVVDNQSEDGTQEYMKTCGKIQEPVFLEKFLKVTGACTYGLKYIKTEYFIMMQDDVIVPDLEPDWLTQLIALFEKYPDHGGIACRVQKIGGVKIMEGDLSPASKALSGYCRIQRLSDMKAVGGMGNRDWEDMEFVKRIRNRLGKKCSWANNIWCNHLGYMCPNKGYGQHRRRWGWSEGRMNVYLEKPYPEIDPKTNVPIPRKKKI